MAEGKSRTETDRFMRDWWPREFRKMVALGEELMIAVLRALKRFMREV